MKICTRRRTPAGEGLVSRRERTIEGLFVSKRGVKRFGSCPHWEGENSARSYGSARREIEMHRPRISMKVSSGKEGGNFGILLKSLE